MIDADYRGQVEYLTNIARALRYFDLDKLRAEQGQRGATAAEVRMVEALRDACTAAGEMRGGGRGQGAMEQSRG